MAFYFQTRAAPFRYYKLPTVAGQVASAMSDLPPWKRSISKRVLLAGLFMRTESEKVGITGGGFQSSTRVHLRSFETGFGKPVPCLLELPCLSTTTL